MLCWDGANEFLVAATILVDEPIAFSKCSGRLASAAPLARCTPLFHALPCPTCNNRQRAIEQGFLWTTCAKVRHKYLGDGAAIAPNVHWTCTVCTREDTNRDHDATPLRGITQHTRVRVQEAAAAMNPLDVCSALHLRNIRPFQRGSGSSSTCGHSTTVPQ